MRRRDRPDLTIITAFPTRLPGLERELLQRIHRPLRRTRLQWRWHIVLAGDGPAPPGEHNGDPAVHTTVLEHGSRADARNLALAYATGAHLLLADPGSRPDPGGLDAAFAPIAGRSHHWSAGRWQHQEEDGSIWPLPGPGAGAHPPGSIRSLMGGWDRACPLQGGELLLPRRTVQELGGWRSRGAGPDLHIILGVTDRCEGRIIDRAITAQQHLPWPLHPEDQKRRQEAWGWT